MTNLRVRLFGTAIIAAAGGFTVGLCEPRTYANPAETIGSLMVFVAGTLFVIDWIVSFFADLKPAKETK